MKCSATDSCIIHSTIVYHTGDETWICLWQAINRLLADEARLCADSGALIVLHQTPLMSTKRRLPFFSVYLPQFMNGRLGTLKIKESCCWIIYMLPIRVWLKGFHYLRLELSALLKSHVLTLADTRRNTALPESFQ